MKVVVFFCCLTSIMAAHEIQAPNRLSEKVHVDSEEQVSSYFANFLIKGILRWGVPALGLGLLAAFYGLARDPSTPFAPDVNPVNTNIHIPTPNIEMPGTNIKIPETNIRKPDPLIRIPDQKPINLRPIIREPSTVSSPSTTVSESLVPNSLPLEAGSEWSDILGGTGVVVEKGFWRNCDPSWGPLACPSVLVVKNVGEKLESTLRALSQSGENSTPKIFAVEKAEDGSATFVMSAFGSRPSTSKWPALDILHYTSDVLSAVRHMHSRGQDVALPVLRGVRKEGTTFILYPRVDGDKVLDLGSGAPATMDEWIKRLAPLFGGKDMKFKNQASVFKQIFTQVAEECQRKMVPREEAFKSHAWDIRVSPPTPNQEPQKPQLLPNINEILFDEEFILGALISSSSYMSSYFKNNGVTDDAAVRAQVEGLNWTLSIRPWKFFD